jgi:ElaB/YqjD/DUF883 family membrane-anchored ribosome-binding protein
MKPILQRIGQVIAIVLSVIVLLSAIGGSVGLWVLQRQIRDLSVAVFAPIDSGLETANKTLDRVKGRVTDARAGVDKIQQFVQQLVQNPTSNGPVLASISETLNTRLGPQIDETRELLGNALDLVIGLNNSLEALNKMPRVNLPTLTDELQTMQTRVTTLDETVQQLRTDLNALIEGRLEIAGTRLNSLRESLDPLLQNIQAAADKQFANIRQAQSRVASLKSDISTWITIGWIGGTMFLLWIAISQVAMLRYAWSLRRPQTT